jgi:hypothetical protein
MEWEAYGDWNSRVARDHAELFVGFFGFRRGDRFRKSKPARGFYERHGPEG